MDSVITLMHHRSLWKRLRLRAPMDVLWMLAATLFATRLSLNSTQPSVKLQALEPAFFFFLFTERSAEDNNRRIDGVCVSAVELPK